MEKKLKIFAIMRRTRVIAEIDGNFYQHDIDEVGDPNQYNKSNSKINLEAFIGNTKKLKLMKGGAQS